jgi:hypothetical protein
MINHVLIDPPSSSFACTHCGTVETLPQPIPDHAFHAWLSSFEGIHEPCLRPELLPPLLLPRALPVGFDPKIAPSGLEDWLRSGDRGLSSETMVSVLTGLHVLSETQWTHPACPDSLNRCESLLRSVPSFRARLGEMSNVSVGWARLIPEWDTLADEMQVELRRGSGISPRTSFRMMALASEI